jgi:hypothetical protein
MHQRNVKTGILESFINTTDKELIGESSTYDQALSGLGFLELGDYDAAKSILYFFRIKWSDTGLSNFYNARSGSCGVETTVHLGPNMWMAMLALHYSRRTGDIYFYKFAKEIALWAIQLKHKNGGLSMGPVSDWGGDWPKIYSSENNIVAYSVFRFLQIHEKDPALQKFFADQMQGIRDFINKVTLQKNRKGEITNVSVGCNPSEAVSPITSCDVVTMLLLVFSPEELRKFFSVDEAALLKFAKENFYVCVDGVCGFDFTSSRYANSIGRPRMISLEWTAQMAQAQRTAAQFYEGNFFTKGKAVNYLKESNELLSNLDKKTINCNEMSFCPYATKDRQCPFPFAPWWKTPEGSPEVCGALSSTLWKFFARRNFNPLRLI